MVASRRSSARHGSLTEDLDELEDHLRILIEEEVERGASEAEGVRTRHHAAERRPDAVRIGGCRRRSILACSRSPSLGSPAARVDALPPPTHRR